MYIANKKGSRKFHDLEEKVVSLIRTLLFRIRPIMGNSAIPNTSALCSDNNK